MVRRFVQQQDFEAVMDMAKAMHRESPIHRAHPFSEARVAALLVAIADFDEFFAQVAYDGGDLVGFSLVMVSPMYFSEDLEMLDFAFYVAEDRRGAIAAVKLVKGWEAWARQQGAVVMRPGVSTGINDERAGAFLEHMGYALTGRQYSKAVG
jgi:GNAT superfamily N-acetyltransferase